MRDQSPPMTKDYLERAVGLYGNVSVHASDIAVARQLSMEGRINLTRTSESWWLALHKAAVAPYRTMEKNALLFHFLEEAIKSFRRKAEDLERDHLVVYHSQAAKELAKEYRELTIIGENLRNLIEIGAYSIKEGEPPK